MEDNFSPPRHPMMSLPINHYGRYDWLDWPTFEEDKFTLVYDERRETTLPSRLVAELHRAYLSALYAIKSRHF
eukprot:6178081-Pleurochrysis_carterae.AAC.2